MRTHLEKGARWSADVDDEDFDDAATDLLPGVSKDLDVDGDDSLAGSLGHLRNVSLTTKVVMAHRHSTLQIDLPPIKPWEKI